MSLPAWIKSLFGITPKRDISRLAPAPNAAAGAAPGPDLEIDETIDISGGPLKEHHRRRALRDKRLLPKARSPARSLGLSKWMRLMPKEEAGRLFAGTLRTRNRNLRDLLPDEEQLERLGLPVWRREEDVADALGVSLKELWFFATHREREQQPHYVTFAIPKRSGGRRLIMAPKRRLKAIQRRLHTLLVAKLPVSDQAHAFRAGRSIRTGAEPHVGQRLVLKMDLRDFFPTVTFARVRGLLIAYGYGYPVACTLAVLMTEAERQPVGADGKVFHVPVGQRHCVQGAPTSPGLCNAMTLRLDRRLQGLARRHQLTYTRYADDLTFSGDMSRAQAHQMRQLIQRIVAEEGFEVNTDKTRLLGRGTRQSVTGVVVNEVLGLSRRDRRRLRAALHQLGQEPESDENLARHNRLEGQLAYLAMLNPAQASQVRRAG